MSEKKFRIDFFELSFLAEACIPKRPIARTMFWHDLINEYYNEMTDDETSRLHSWITKNPNFKDTEPDCVWFDKRYDPNNQYVVTAKYKGKKEKHRAFKVGERYYTKMNTWIDDVYIINIEKYEIK